MQTDSFLGVSIVFLLKEKWDSRVSHSHDGSLPAPTGQVREVTLAT